MNDGKIGASADSPRRVRALPLDSMKDGQIYEGWQCRARQLFIAIDPSWPEVPRIPDAHYVTVDWPQCNTSRVGTWGGREKLQYVNRLVRAISSGKTSGVTKQ